VSQKAVKYIKQLKGAGAQEVIVLHVIDDKEWPVPSKVPDQYLQDHCSDRKGRSRRDECHRADMTADGFHVKLKSENRKSFHGNYEDSGRGKSFRYRCGFPWQVKYQKECSWVLSSEKRHQTCSGTSLVISREI